MEKAKKLGIPEDDLKAALILVRNLRIQALQSNLDPRATRIAIIYADMVDDHFASQQLNSITLSKLESIALNLFKETKRSIEA